MCVHVRACVCVWGRARERESAQYGCEKDVDGGRHSFAATECGVKRKRVKRESEREGGRSGPLMDRS